MKKRFFYIFLSFLIPFLCLIVVFFLKGYFTKNTIIIGDAYAQYYPFFTYYKGILNGDNTIFFTLSKNLGGSMFGTYFYYLSSPFNFFMFFLSKSSIPFFYTMLTIIKISLCGLTMYIYMSYKNNENNFVIIMFSVCYALMGYNINFYVNIMWLDIVLLAPIVLLGLDKIICNKSPLIYIISLSLCIFSNYYISYMLCIFCVLYFIYEILLRYSLSDKKVVKSIIITFIISSLLSGLLCSFFLLPCVFEAMNYSRSLELGSILKFDYNFFDLFSKTYIGSIGSKDLVNYSSMNLYCSIITIPLVYFYVVNRSVPKRERRLTLYFVVFMILPCFLFPLNYVWHLFSKPSFYSYRFSFLLCFFIINIAYKSFKNLNMEKFYVLAYLAFYSIVSFYFVIITYFGQYYESLNYKYIWITLFVLFVYFFILRLKNKKIQRIFFVCLLLGDNVLNLGIIFYNYDSFSSDNLSYDKYYNIVEKYKSDMMDFTAGRSSNDSILMGYHGVNNFISTNNSRVIKFLVQSGLKEKYSVHNYYSYQDGQYILDSIVGLKYVISPSQIDNYNIVDTFEFESDNMYVLENPSALGLGYIINDECNNIDFSFVYDEKVYNCISGTNTRYFKEYKFEKSGDGVYTVIIKYPKSFYIYYPDLFEIDFEFDNQSLVNYSKDFIHIKNDKERYKYTFVVNDEINDDDLKFYYFDYDSFIKDSKKLSDEQMAYKVENNKIIGSINTDGGLLMLNIPYEKGYLIKVDNKLVNYKKVLDTFVGVDLSGGNHDIEVSYEQPFLKEGMIISFLSFIAFIVYIRYKYLQKKL